MTTTTTAVGKCYKGKNTQREREREWGVPQGERAREGSVATLRITNDSETTQNLRKHTAEKSHCFYFIWFSYDIYFYNMHYIRLVCLNVRARPHKHTYTHTHTAENQTKLYYFTCFRVIFMCFYHSLIFALCFLVRLVSATVEYTLHDHRTSEQTKKNTEYKMRKANQKEGLQKTLRNREGGKQNNEREHFK